MSVVDKMRKVMLGLSARLTWLFKAFPPMKIRLSPYYKFQLLNHGKSIDFIQLPYNVYFSMYIYLLTFPNKDENLTLIQQKSVFHLTLVHAGYVTLFPVRSEAFDHDHKYRFSFGGDHHV